MKKIILLFIITILLTGCNLNSEKRNIKSIKQKSKEDKVICLRGERCLLPSLEKNKGIKELPQLDKIYLENTDNLINDNIININNIESGGTEESTMDEDMMEEYETEESTMDEDMMEEYETEESTMDEDMGSGDFTYLNFGEINFDNNTIEITFDSIEEIRGFQFYLSAGDNEIVIIDAFGGLAEEYNVDVMVGNGTNIILGFSLEGYGIPSGSGVLTNLSFDNVDNLDLEICLSELVISGAGGQELDTIDPVCSSIN